MCFRDGGQSVYRRKGGGDGGKKGGKKKVISNPHFLIFGLRWRGGGSCK